MVNDVLKELQANLDKAIEALKKDLGKVRTGRASVSILDGIRVDYYGTPTPLNQVASLNVPDPRLITIKPWEKSLIPEIEKTIRSSQLGLNPSSDGEIVRLPMPPLTEERRKELVKLTKKMGEAMLNDLVSLITKHLKKGERIRIAGLGILQVRKRAARMGRNPATGEAIKIKASKKVAFRAAKDLKMAV